MTSTEQSEPAPTPTPLSILFAAVSVALIVFAIIILILLGNYWLPGLQNEIGVDISYRMVLNTTPGSDFVYGRDLIITHGPLGFVAMAEPHPIATPLRLIINSIVTVLTVVLFVHAFTPRGAFAQPRYWLAIALYLAVAIMIGLSWPLIIYSSVVLLFAVISFGAPERAFPGRREILLLLVATAALTKFTYFGSALSTVILVAIFDIVKYKRIPWVLPEFGVAFVLMWLVCGQPLNALPEFIGNYSDLASNYGTALSLMGDRVQEASFLLLYLLIGGLASAIVGFAAWQRDRWLAIIPTLALGAFVYIGLKTAFVRYSPSHVMQGFIYLAAFGALCAPAFSPLFERRRLLWGSALLAVPFAALFLVVSIVDDTNPLQRLMRAPESVARAVTGATTYLENPDIYRQRYDEGLDAIRGDSVLPESPGGYDIISDEQAYLFANRVRYAPRPVFQSINTVSAHLMELNAAHLRSDAAAQTILFRTEDADNKFPGINNSLMQPELWTRYDMSGFHPPFAVLTRSETPGTYAFTPISRATIRLHQAWDPPEAPALWARVRVRLNLLGRLVNFIYKLPPLYIEVDKADGNMRPYRILTSVAEAGFLLSPVLDSTDDFLSFPDASEEPARADQRVANVRIPGPGIYSMFYEDRVDIEYSALHITRPAPFYHQGEAATEQRRIIAALARRSNLPTARVIQLWQDGEPMDTLRLEPGFQTNIDAPPGARTLSFMIHVDEEAGPMADRGFVPKPDGVAVTASFRSAARAPLGSRTIIVDPGSVTSDRRPVELVFALPAGTARIDLATDQRTNSAVDTASFYNFHFTR